jgi:hypothetical protein
MSDLYLFTESSYADNECDSCVLFTVKGNNGKEVFDKIKNKYNGDIDQLVCAWLKFHTDDEGDRLEFAKENNLKFVRENKSSLNISNGKKDAAVKSYIKNVLLKSFNKRKKFLNKIKDHTKFFSWFSFPLSDRSYALTTYDYKIIKCDKCI